MSVYYSEIVTIDPQKRGGKPRISELRITAYDVPESLASGMTEGQFLAYVPDLQTDDIKASPAFTVDRERRLVSLPPQ